MRKTGIAAFSATRAALVGNGLTFQTGGSDNNTCDTANAFPMGPRGVRSSSPFPEPNTAIYDSYLSWTYFQPLEVKIEKLPAPDPKYYQHHTKRPWDVSCTELLEIVSRRKFLQMWCYIVVCFYLYFLMPKEKSYSGLRGSDGYWIMLPKNEPEKF